MIFEQPPPPRLGEKLKFVKSPILDEASDSAIEYKQPEHQPVDPDVPVLDRREEPTDLEIFFDLFFAANYAIFTKNQSIYSLEQFASHVSYFSMLWMTWLVLAFYDVRYATDSIYARVAKGVHLGVMVGFAVVAPTFDPNKQIQQTMKTMSLILAVSRFALAAEYASAAWYIRKYKKAGVGLYLQIGLCLVASMIYLGIAFRFSKGTSRVFVTWYVVGVAEVLLAFLLSNFSLVLSFTRSHLMKRLATLTVIILGDGIVIMAEKIVVITKQPDPWTSTTIGATTAATSIVYFIFLIYFDWIRDFYLPPLRQQLWTLLHFPFHLALVVWQTCFAQFITWSKILDVFIAMEPPTFEEDPGELVNDTSKVVGDKWENYTQKWLDKYPSKWDTTEISISAALGIIRDNITDKFWSEYATFSPGVPLEGFTEEKFFEISYLYGNATETLKNAVQNCLFANYEVDLIAEEVDSKTLNQTAEFWADGKQEVNYFNKTNGRFVIVFTYGYVAVGIVLVLLTILSAMTRRTKWKPWPIVRTIVCLILSAGLSLIVLVGTSDEASAGYLTSHMMLPVVCLTMFVMLLLTHIHSDVPRDVFKRAPTFFSSRHQSPRRSIEAEYNVASKTF